MEPSEVDQTVGPPALSRSGIDHTPVRGSIGLTVSASSPETVASSDFSIFVIAQNPFEVPVTLYQVQTHIPVELIDVNPARVVELRGVASPASPKGGIRAVFTSLVRRISARLAFRRLLREGQRGVATALGTSMAPDTARSALEGKVTIGGNVVGATVSGITMNFPENPTSEELDAVFRRAVDYEEGVVPVTLQPGDSVVRQFVLRTRSRVLFTPLTHTFQIQATYALDGVDHTAQLCHMESIYRPELIPWPSAV
jgi:hypothetical protein